MAATPQSDDRRALGRWGERLAARHLENAGYAILAEGWRCRFGEIDLIAVGGETLVFVEVRTRRGGRQGSPEESITPAKAARLARLASQYLGERAAAGDPWDGPYRIDVIAIALDGAGRLQRLNHLEAAI